MKNQLHDDHDARLRAALRGGDPAAGDRLATEEVWALRRALHAAEEAGRRAWLPAAALAAGAAVVAAAVVLSFVQVRTDRAAAPRVAARTASPQATVASPNASSVAPEPALSPPEPPAAAPPARSARVETPAASPRLEPPTQPLLADAAAEPRPLQIQFATPGGTRIIWVLAEESES